MIRYSHTTFTWNRNASQYSRHKALLFLLGEIKREADREIDKEEREKDKDIESQRKKPERTRK